MVARQALRRSALFNTLDDEELDATIARLRRRRVRQDEVIFHRGDPGDAMHVVESGMVKISLESAEGDDAFLAVVMPGAAFGEIALMDGRQRSATATAREACTTLSLTRDAFGELMQDA